jgi:nucleoporin NUP82
VTALTKQLPPGTVFAASPRSVLMHPPSTIKPQPLRQGPFLLQPAPRIIEGSFGGDATDITYLAFGMDDDDFEDDGRDTERLGVVFVAYQDGKVDLFLDVEKVEARWNIKQVRDISSFKIMRNLTLV